MKQITPNVYVEISKHGCNPVFVVTSDGILAHDSPIMKDNNALKWAAEIAKHGTVKYVISGEPHGDHTGGLCYLGGTLIGHEGGRPEIVDTQDQYEKGLLKFKLPPESGFSYRAPDLVIKDDITIYMGNHTFKIFVMPGHTPWNICTYIPEEKVIFASDDITRDPPVLYDSVPYEWIESLEFMKTLDFDIIVPGHGDVMAKSDIDGFIAEIKMWVKPVEEAVEKGESLEWVKENITMEKEYPDLAERLPQPAIASKNVARIYNYLKSRAK